MEGIGFIVMLMLISLLTLVIPIGLSFLINEILKKKTINSKWRILSLIPILFAGYFIYNAIYPNESFYREDFKEVTGIELPNDSKFEYKTASYPDHFGDYTSISLIKVKKEFYYRLKNRLIDKGQTENKKQVNPREFFEIKNKFKGEEIDNEYIKEIDGKSYYVGFLSDRESIIVKRVSW